jgi:uridine kinase
MRRLRRDIAERGRTMESVLVQYDRFVKPGFRTYALLARPCRVLLSCRVVLRAVTRFVEPSMLDADLIVPRARDNTAAQEVVFRTIQHILDGEKILRGHSIAL